MGKTVIVVIAVIACIALALPALSIAEKKSTDSRGKPKSFVPHPHKKHGAYGAPIQRAILGRAKTSRHKNARKKQTSSLTTGPARSAPT